MLQIAERFEIRRLLIPGDFIDFDVLYPRDTGHERRTIKDEVKATWKILDVLCQHFDEIIWTMGNHDIRLLKLIQRLRRQIMAQKGGTELLDFLSEDGIKTETPFGILNSIFARPGLKIHEASYARIQTSRGDYLVMHPKNISQVGPQSARRYVEKYRASCLCAHSHLWAIGTDRSGIDLAVDLGAACDPDKINYYCEELGTFPATVPAFSMIRNGSFYSFTLNPKYTDWSFWLI
jgi:hypothetical protein